MTAVPPDLERLLTDKPQRPELYLQALQHRSITDNVAASNERLEFLGDAILRALLSDYLFARFPDESEGFLTRLRAKLESREQLNRLADKIGLTPLIQYDKQALSPEALLRNALPGNTLEALIGAIYLDHGQEGAMSFIRHLLEKYVNIHTLITKELNPKGRLLEWAQQHRKKVEFQTSSSPENQHPPEHHVKVWIAGKLAGSAKASTKKKAEQEAASEALNGIVDCS